jgi:hypothetical protein
MTVESWNGGTKERQMLGKGELNTFFKNKSARAE